MDINEITETLEDLIIRVQRLENKVASLITSQTSLKDVQKSLENRVSALEQATSV